jgi:hypothetical protein
MCDTGHTETREDVRGALQRLEEALAQHERHMAGVGGDTNDPALQVLQRSLVLMRQEADRLRHLLRED